MTIRKNVFKTAMALVSICVALPAIALSQGATPTPKPDRAQLEAQFKKADADRAAAKE
ncbi:MAG: hypothetical protein QOJ05_697, partial [Verrucomicrobiota bacterium]